MSLTLITGCMYSGKSAELISRTEPYRIANKTVQYVKPFIDRRNNGVESRLGARADAITVKDLTEVPEADVYAVDEAHMLPVDSYKTIAKWLDDGAVVIIATLDTTYDGTVFPTIVRIYSLKPDELILKTAVCHVCRTVPANAKYTQILSQDDVPQVDGLPEDLVEDGRYKYEARCRACFVSNKLS